MNPTQSIISLEAARQILAEVAAPLPPVRLALPQAGGLRLAETLHADLDLPHWDVSAMDGYAVRAQDLKGAPLPVVFEVCAGQAPPPLPPGTACRIYTGAVIPEGADTVAPQEQARVVGDGFVELESQPRGNHVRHRGEVLPQGALIGRPGDCLTPGQIALLASGGAAEMCVIPRPRVAVVMTGSELVSPDRQPGIGAIRDSNSPMLQVLIEKARFTFVGKTACSDDLDETCRTLEAACHTADLVVTSGGVSVGDWDFVPEAVGKLGGIIHFHRISIKPGKPLLAAQLGSTWIMGLPGNPVSVLVCWRMFALPLGLALSGDPAFLKEKPSRAKMTAPLTNTENRLLLHPGRLNSVGEEALITPLPWKGSHDIASAAQAEALICLEANASARAGEEVLYYSI